MAQVAQRMTADEYLAHPGDGRRWMLVEGEVILNQPALPHQVVLMKLILALGDWVRAEDGRGLMTLPLDVRIDDYNVFGPDVMWYAEGHAPEHEARPYPLPDVAVEVRSPSTWRYDIGAKKAGYERAGLAELWLVDTAADEVLVFRRSSPDAAGFDISLELCAGEQLGSPRMPGFALALSDLFAG
ncbi:MAG: Uma2 family endonuclease [Solirubrobacteraceae bacterium]